MSKKNQELGGKVSDHRLAFNSEVKDQTAVSSAGMLNPSVGVPYHCFAWTCISHFRSLMYVIGKSISFLTLPFCIFMFIPMEEED